MNSRDNSGQLVVNVKGCARCGQNHCISFSKFTKSPLACGDETYGYWGICPELKEPIVLRITSQSMEF